MLRKLFTDFVVVFALCTAVWGAAPVLAFVCTCEDKVSPKCTLTETISESGQPVQLCSHSGWCGTTKV